MLDSASSFIIHNDEYEDDDFNIYTDINNKENNNTHDNEEGG